MSKKTPARALRIYTRLAHAFPHEFKVVYGADVIQLGEDVVEEIAREHGMMGLIRLIADIAIRVPMEYLSEMRRDMVYAIRGLIKSPGFALVGILSLGLGIGVTTSIFSTLWAQMFHPLAGVAKPNELVLSLQNPESYEYIEKYREQHGLLAGVTAFQNAVPFNVAFPGSSAKPERVFGHLIEPEYFSVLGAKAQRGRLIDARLDKFGDAPVVVISDRFWHERMNGDMDAVGRMILLNGQAATVVGIAPEGFQGVAPMIQAELFVPVTVPVAMAPELAGDILHKHDAKDFIPLFRLARGVSISSAEAGLDTITRHLDEEAVGPANGPTHEDKTRRVTLVEGGFMVPVPRQIKPVLVGFYSVLVGLILTIACMNLATMLLARGAARRKEVAIRLAVGASRFRLIRQMVSESLLLSVSGGVLGLAFAFWIAHLTSQLKLPLSVPVHLDYALDWHAAFFTLFLAIVCGLGFSLAPALQVTKADVAPTLKEGSNVHLRGYRTLGMRNFLVLGQVAGSLMLLLLMGFFVIGFQRSASLHARFDANTMYLMSIDPVRDGYSAEKAQALFEGLPERLREVGAVRSVALATQPPFAIIGGASVLDEQLDDSKASAKTLQSVAKAKIGAGYFAALSEPILAGREFDDRDQRRDAAKQTAIPAILDEDAAQGLFGSESPVGRVINENHARYEVIGMVHDLKSGFPASGQAAGVLYLPLTRDDFAHPPAGGMTIMVRSDAGADALSGVRRKIAEIDPNLAVFNVQSLNEFLDLSRAYLRLGIDMYGGIGVFGLVLASIGLAGVTAYAVARRKREIGIRMAMGARKGQVLRLVLREGMWLVITGTALGFLGAVGVARVLRALTSIFVDAFNTTMNDPLLLVGAPVLLGVLAMIACYIPARRSMKVDPLRALREE